MRGGMKLLLASAGTASLVVGAWLSSATPVGAATARHGGTLVVAMTTNVNWYLPLSGGYNSLGSNFEIDTQLYKPLLWVNGNYTINYRSSIASNVTWNRSGTVYHVFLNPKWHWSDGSPVTTKDILFTWHVIQAASASHAPSPWPYVGAGSGDIPTGVKSLVANGNYAFTITLKKPANQEWFLYNGINQLTPMPAQAWDKYPTDMAKEIRWLGNEGINPSIDTPVDGPFELTKAISNNEWVLVPNPKYDGHKPYLSKVVFQYEASDSAEFAALESGALQVGTLPNSFYKSRALLRNDVIRPVYSFGFSQTLINMLPNSQGHVNRIFDQLYIRQALQMSINERGMIDAFYNGQGLIGNGPIPSKPHTIFFDPQLRKPLYPFNLAKAKALLEQHGWREVDGVMTKGNEKLSFVMVYPSGSSAFNDEVVLQQADWARIGVKVTLDPMPFATMNALPPQKWEIMAGENWGYGGAYPTGYQLFDPQGGIDSTVGFSSAEEDHLIALTHEPWPNEKVNMQHFYQYEYYTTEQVANLWMPNTPTFTVNAKDVHGSYRFSSPVTGSQQLQYWWIG